MSGGGLPWHETVVWWQYYEQNDAGVRHIPVTLRTAPLTSTFDTFLVIFSQRFAVNISLVSPRFV